MKYILKPAIFLFLPTLFFAACKKNRFGELRTSGVTIVAQYPSTYSQQGASGADITLTSTLDGSVKTATTNAQGQAIFPTCSPARTASPPVKT